MAPSGWAIHEQRVWLESRVSDFQQAQRSLKTQAFRHEVHSAFFEKWPNPASEVSSEANQKQSKSKTGSALSAPLLPIAEWTDLRKKQITNWFNNYKGVSKRRIDGGAGSAPIINLGGSESRLSSEIQIYSRLFYDTRVKPVADRAMVGLAANDPTRIAIINKCTTNAWKNEDDETKAAVYKERDNEKKAKERLKKNGKSSTPEEFASALITLPATIDAFFKEMGMRTGWSFTVLAGGPEPSHAEGKIRTLAIHVGVDRFDQQFSKAHDKFYDNCVIPFAAFLENVYSPEECKSRVLKKADPIQSLETLPSSLSPAEQTTPQTIPAECEQATHTFNQPHQIPQDMLSLPATTSPSPTKHTIPQTIPAECEQAPHTLNQPHQIPQDMLSLPTTASLQVGVEPCKPDQSTASLSLITASPHSDPLGPGKPYPPTRMWPQDQESVDPTALKPLLGKMPHVENTLVNHTFVDPTALAALWQSEPSFPYGSNFGGSNIPVNGQLYDFGSSNFESDVSQPPVPTGTIHDDTLLEFSRRFTTSGTSGTLLPEILPESALPDDTLLEFSRRFTTSGTSGTLLPEILPESALPLTSSTILGPLPLTDGTVNHPVPPTDSTTHLIQDEVETKSSDKENRSTRVRKPTTSKQMPTMWRDQAYRYLLVDLEDDNWKDCIEKWLAFEKQEEGALDTTSYRIGVKSRPPLFSKWVGNRNFNALPQIPNYTDFANDWIRWWNSVQPKWRQNPANGIPFDVSSGKSKDSLSSVRKGGPSGLVTLLFGLKWWADIRDSDPRWNLAVLDLTACLTYFITGTTKRKGNDVPEEGKKKRRKVG